MSYQIVLFFVSDKMVPFPLSVTASHMLMLWLAGSAAPACSAQWQENADAVPKQTNKTWMVGSMAISNLTQSIELKKILLITCYKVHLQSQLNSTVKTDQSVKKGASKLACAFHK